MSSREAAPMPADAVERKLVAILAADIVGYSRLVGLDEEGTLARLKGLRRELIDPTISEQHGRIVKTTGDRDRIVSGCGPTRREDRAP
jgi:adenylate cyclase